MFSQKKIRPLIVDVLYRDLPLSLVTNWDGAKTAKLPQNKVPTLLENFQEIIAFAHIFTFCHP